MTAEIHYLGGLRTSSKHLQSGTEISTDAPIDNNGKGELFSPTDLVASATVSCMLTLAGIAANTHQFSIEGAKGTVKKTMGTQPRRITQLDIHISLPAQLNEKERKIAEKAITGCPVVESIHPDIQLNLEIEYLD